MPQAARSSETAELKLTEKPAEVKKHVVRDQGPPWGYIIPLAAMAIGTIVAILIKYHGLPH